MKQILAGSAVIVTIILLITVAYLRFSSISVDKPEPKQKVSTTQQKPRANRILSRTFTIPGNQTITAKNMYYIYYGNGKRDRIIVEILDGPYKNLLWLNENLPAIQIKKPKTIIYAAPPGVNKKNQIKFMNIGAEPITVQVRIIPYRT